MALAGCVRRGISWVNREISDEKSPLVEYLTHFEVISNVKCGYFDHNFWVFTVACCYKSWHFFTILKWKQNHKKLFVEASFASRKKKILQVIEANKTAYPFSHSRVILAKTEYYVGSLFEVDAIFCYLKYEREVLKEKTFLRYKVQRCYQSQEKQ